MLSYRKEEEEKKLHGEAGPGILEKWQKLW
jgi:hypothetical protein